MRKPKIYFSVVLFIVAEVCSIQAYRRYYVEDECTSPNDFQKIFFRLPPTGPDSVGELRSNRFGTYSRTGRNCLIKLVPPKGYGVLVTILRVDFRNHEQCKDFLKVNVNKDEGEKLCGLMEVGKENKTFYSDKEIRLHYHTEVGGMGFSSGFRLIFTVTKLETDGSCTDPDEFQCRNTRCIWTGVTCDGVNNCGDGSDENSVEHPHCNEITPLAIAAVVLGVLSFIGILILMCLCCCPSQKPSFCKSTSPDNFPLRPHHDYLPLPGYDYDSRNTAAPNHQSMYYPLTQPSVPERYTHSCWTTNSDDCNRKFTINYDRQPPPPYVA